MKPDKFTESGLPVLGMIMDLRASNTILEQLEGDVSTLTGAASFQKIVMGEGDELLLSGDDLTAAFYLFKLPEAFAEYLVLRKPVRNRSSGRARCRHHSGGHLCLADGMVQRSRSDAECAPTASSQIRDADGGGAAWKSRDPEGRIVPFSGGRAGLDHIPGRHHHH